MRPTAAALAFCALFNTAAPAQAEQGTILKPKINGVEVEINCARDFPNGHPTMAFLERLDTQVFHQGQAGSVSFLTASEAQRQIILKPAHGIARMQFEGMARSYDRAADKIEFVTKLLEKQHRFPVQFYANVAAKCEQGR